MMSRIRVSAFWLVSLFVLVSPHVLAADAASLARRNIQFSNITTEAGLSSEFVHDVAQDGRGYIWFATQAGLNRYDGHELKVYENVASEPSSLSHSFVWSLHVDSTGELWIGTERGINRYNAEKDEFERHPFKGLSLTGYRIRRVLQDARGVFWLGTLGDGLVAIDPVSNTMRHFRHQEDDKLSIPNDHIMALLTDHRGQVWVGTDGGGLARFDATTDSFVVYRNKPDNPLTLGGERIRSLFEDKVGNIWVGTAQGGLSRLDPASGRFTRFQNQVEDPASLPSGQVTAVHEDEHGTLWVGTENGLAEWRETTRSFANYRSNTSSQSSLANNRINSIIHDASGVLWLATHGGVSTWNYFSDTFSYYSTTEEYLESDLVSSVNETSDGVLWVGTYGGGLSAIDPVTTEVVHYRFDENEPTSLPDDRVMAVHVDGDDQVWVGTRDGGLALKREDGFDRIVADVDDEASLSGDAITSILRDSRGDLWVGVFDGGLNRSTDGGKTFERYMHDATISGTLSGDRVLAIYEDRSGVIWIGTEGAGLNRYNPETNSFTSFDLGDAIDGHETGPSGTPWEIREALDGTIWLGTLGQGLFGWTKEDRQQGISRFTQLSSAQGLASEVYGVIEGAHDELWVSSNRGLFRFHPSSRAIRKFDRNNGLRTNEFNQGARYRSRSGRLFFGSTAGLVGFFPGELPANERPPMIALEANSRTETIARTGTGQATPHATLDYFDAFISFDFVALDFTSPDKNHFRYRMRGLETDWANVDDFRRAVYSSLSPGDYTFEVHASNNDGVWNRAGAEVDVHVVPPPWQTWWAYLIYTAFIASLVVWYLLNQRAKQLAEAETRARLERLVTERTAELAERNADLTSLNEKLEQASVTDALTGLHNRRFVNEHIEAEVSMLKRQAFEEEAEPNSNPESPRLLFLMMIDLDGFKAVNDTHGHHAGDRTLLEVKDRLLAGCRKSDAVVRWGGDEFLIIGHARNYEGAEQFAEKIRESVASPAYDVGDGNVSRLSASIGMSYLPFVEGDIDFAGWELVCNVADIGAYLAKGAGRNGWISIMGTKALRQDELGLIQSRLIEFVKDKKLIVSSSPSTEIKLV